MFSTSRMGFLFASFALLGGIGTVCGAAPKGKGAPPSADDARRKQMQTELRSGNADEAQKAFADLKQWFNETPLTAENSFWRLRGDFLEAKGHDQDFLDVVDLAEQAKRNDRNYRHRNSVGYLYVLRGCGLLRQGKQSDGLAQIQKGLAIDQAGAGAEAVDQLPRLLLAEKRYKDLEDTMNQVILAAPDNPKVVEPALKQCISALNEQSKYPEALADAKSLFNVATLPHTADALTILDRQLALLNIQDRATVEKFRQEETDGANPPAGDGTAHTSTIVLGIKVDASPYETALQGQVDDSFGAMLHHSALLLVADQPDDALKIAKRAYAQAGNARDIAAATDMIARCFKAQDGTIGRANAWIAGPTAAPTAADVPH